MSYTSDQVERLERRVEELTRLVLGQPVRLGDSGGGGGGADTLGCYLTRAGGPLTINLDALFGEGFALGDEEPCPKVHTAGGGISLPDPPSNSFLIFSTPGGQAWRTLPKTIVRGFTDAHSGWDDAAYPMTVTDLMAGTAESGVSITVRKHLGSAALGALPFGNRRAYRKHQHVIAAFNDTDNEWDDITPGEGAWITAILRENVPPAEWNPGGKSLRPKPFTAYWFARENGFPGTRPLLYVGPIMAENRSMEAIDNIEAGKATVINLVYSEGVFTIPFAADCETFTY